jgi:SAM-dependent methyltransferase
MSEGPPGSPTTTTVPARVWTGGLGVARGTVARVGADAEFDAYWKYRDAFFALVPPPSGRTLEVGCGEGRVARDLAGRGHRVTALDASPTLLRAAAERDPRGEYVLGTAEALPFADASFDLVVAYNVLIDVDDMARAVREAARVLARGGRMCVCVPHPVADAGRWEGDGEDRFVVTGSYRRARAFTETMERGGLTMTFDGMAYPLEDYARALEDAGLLIEAIREPAPADHGPDWARWHRVPMFLMLRALKPAV